MNGNSRKTGSIVKGAVIREKMNGVIVEGQFFRCSECGASLGLLVTLPPGTYRFGCGMNETYGTTLRSAFQGRWFRIGPPYQMFFPAPGYQLRRSEEIKKPDLTNPEVKKWTDLGGKAFKSTQKEAVHHFKGAGRFAHKSPGPSGIAVPDGNFSCEEVKQYAESVRSYLQDDRMHFRTVEADLAVKLQRVPAAAPEAELLTSEEFAYHLKHAKSVDHYEEDSFVWAPEIQRNRRDEAYLIFDCIKCKTRCIYG